MRCDEFEARLQGLLDRRGQFESDETLSVHADTCASCAARLAAYEALLETLPLLSVPESSDDLTDRVLNELAVRPARQVAWRVPAGLLAVAAALTLAMLPMLRRPRDFADQPVPARLPATLAATEKLSLEPLSNGLRRRPMDLVARQTGDGLAVAFLSLRGMGNSQDSPAWVGQVKDELRPVTNSMSGAINVLLRAVPAVDTGSRESNATGA